MSNVLWCGFMAVVLFTPGCMHPDSASKRAAKTSSNGEHPASNSAPIGTATMMEDGTIILNLRAQSGGTIGHGQLTYRKADKGYADVLEHLGGLQPGQSRPVPPWPDSQ